MSMRPDPSSPTRADDAHAGALDPAVQAVLDGCRELDRVVCSRLQHAAALSSDATIRVIQHAAELQSRAQEAATELDGIDARCRSAGTRLDEPLAALAVLAAQPGLPPLVREQLLAAAGGISQARLELRQVRDAALALRGPHVDGLEGIVGQLMDAGQYQDSFAQIIDRVSPALGLRHAVTERTARALSAGAELDDAAAQARGLAASYEDAEACHRDPQVQPDGPGAEFF